jgi:hypothetical protein
MAEDIPGKEPPLKDPGGGRPERTPTAQALRERAVEYQRMSEQYHRWARQLGLLASALEQGQPIAPNTLADEALDWLLLHAREDRLT